MSQTDTMTASTQTKFSRYRSVRNAAAASQTEVAGREIQPESQAAGLSRAPSRYRRPTRPRTQDAPALPTSPTVPSTYPNSSSPKTPLQNVLRKEQTSPRQHVQPPTVPITASLAHRNDKPPYEERQFVGDSLQPQILAKSTVPRSEHTVGRMTSNSTQGTASKSPRSYEAAREEARMILEGEYDRLQKMKEDQRSKDRHLRSKITTADTPARAQTIKQSNLDKVKQNPTKYNEDILKDGPRNGSNLETQKHPIRPLTARDAAPVLKSDGNSLPAHPVLEQRHDAPVSAVNSGERRVEVRYSGATVGITLPVTPTTTVRDLLNSASTCMSQDFDPRSAVLVESFGYLGLERPLRRYEHVRDVMNSWDIDTQNHLMIMLESECTATGLDQKDCPSHQPSETMVQMSHSLKPGKWEKRLVCLRTDGQVTVSRHEKDKDVINICHLSDFDIYTPSKRQLKKLKAPKRICIAIKSQQKSAMFLEGVNYVHFFATSDKVVASQWYTAVQNWRSWYLVNVLGEGNQHKATQETKTAAGDGQPLTSQSEETIPYQLGSFKPLLDLSNMGFGPSVDIEGSRINQHGHRLHSRPSVDLDTPRKSTDHRRSTDDRRGSRHNQAPPSAFPSGLLQEARNKTAISFDHNEQAFTGTGLLARSASRRSQAGRALGHGVTGSKGKPLIDLAGESEFLEGSLLRKLEAWSATQGTDEPKVDRQRRVEADVRVGEAI